MQINNLELKIRLYWRARQYAKRKDLGEIRFIRNFLQKGQSAFDIGCHKGGYLYWMRKAVGPDGSVFAFEPQPLLSKYLQQSVRAFGWQNVRVEQCGVADHTSEMELFVSGKLGNTSPGASFNLGPRDGEEYHTLLVPVVTLDEFTHQHSVSHINLLKVDVEGYELNVFKGAENILSTQCPAIVFECEQKHLVENSLEDVFNYLFRFGYDGYFFHGGRIRPLKEFDIQKYQKANGERYWKSEDYCNNFLFIPKGINMEF